MYDDKLFVHREDAREDCRTHFNNGWLTGLISGIIVTVVSGWIILEVLARY